jgi:hypothetical protein
MKNELIHWSTLLEDKLTDEDMNNIRGGDAIEDPNGPIVK